MDGADPLSGSRPRTGTRVLAQASVLLAVGREHLVDHRAHGVGARRVDDPLQRPRRRVDRPGLVQVGELRPDRHLGARADGQPCLGHQVLDDAGVAARERRRGARRGGASERNRVERLRLAPLRVTPDPDRHLTAGRDHPGQLGDRDRRVDGVLDGVERGDRVEAPLLERQLLDVADPQVRSRGTAARHVQQRSRGVQATDDRAALRGEREGQAGSAAGVQVPRAGQRSLPVQRVQRGREQRPHLRLEARRPLLRVASPQLALHRRRSHGVLLARSALLAPTAARLRPRSGCAHPGRSRTRRAAADWRT